MSLAPGPPLRELFDSGLGAFLAAQDTRIRGTRRNRWIVLLGGLALAGAILAWVVVGEIGNDLVPMAGFAIAVGAILFFRFTTAEIADDVRHRMMAGIAPLLGLEYEPRADGFDLSRFDLLGLTAYEKVTRSDRLRGVFDGISVELMAARLASVSTSGIGDKRETHTVERFSGLLLRVTDPAPTAARFRLVPPAIPGETSVLNDISIVTHTTAPDSMMLSMDEAEQMLAATAEAAPPTPTGDAVFDARFELHAKDAELPAALSRLDAETRAALLDIAANFDGGPVSVGFDHGDILFAFITRRRFEIGPLRPPMAQFGRLEHLAAQMAVLSLIAERLRATQAAPR